MGGGPDRDSRVRPYGGASWVVGTGNDLPLGQRLRKVELKRG